MLKWTEHRLTTTAEPASLRSFQQFLELHAQIYDTINREQTFTSFRQQNNRKTLVSDFSVKDFSVPMAHYKASSQINNQNLFGKDNSKAVSQPAIKPQINTSNRDWSSSITISNNTKANGKQQNNDIAPIAIITIFWQLVPSTKSNHHKIDINDRQQHSPQDLLHLVLQSIHQMKCHQSKTNINTVAMDNLLVKRKSQILREVPSILLQIIKASA